MSILGFLIFVFVGLYVVLWAAYWLFMLCGMLVLFLADKIGDWIARKAPKG